MKWFTTKCVRCNVECVVSPATAQRINANQSFVMCEPCALAWTSEETRSGERVHLIEQSPGQGSPQATPKGHGLEADDEVHITIEFTG